MIPKILFQTSKNKLDDYSLQLNSSFIDEEWTYHHFTDLEIINFFNNNKLQEFPDIVEVFKSIESGEYKADLFRYYFLYLNGGVYIDSDLELTKSLNEYLEKYNFFSVKSGCQLAMKQDCIFNGLLACEPKNKIIYESLLQIYEFFKSKKSVPYYEFFCVCLSNNITKFSNLYSIKLFEEHDTGYISVIYDIDTYRRLGIHYHVDGCVFPIELKIKKITELYKKILKRNPDKEGLKYYTNSNLSLHQIESELFNSKEYELNNYKDAFEYLQEDLKKSITKTTIYSGERVVIDYYKHNTPKNNLVFSINGLLIDGVNLNNLGFYGKKLLEWDYDVIFFNSNELNYYKSVPIEVLENIKTSIVKNYNNIISIGVCMGATTAIELSKNFNIKKSILFAPSQKDGYTINKNDISTECHYYIACNYNHLEDKRYFDYFCNLIPKENLTKIRVDDDSGVHAVGLTLKRAGILSDFFRELLKNEKIIDNPALVIDN